MVVSSRRGWGSPRGERSWNGRRRPSSLGRALASSPQTAKERARTSPPEVPHPRLRFLQPSFDENLHEERTSSVRHQWFDAGESAQPGAGFLFRARTSALLRRLRRRMPARVRATVGRVADHVRSGARNRNPAPGGKRTTNQRPTDR